jgi:hypothetical protein
MWHRLPAGDRGRRAHPAARPPHRRRHRGNLSLIAERESDPRWHDWALAQKQKLLARDDP